MKYWEKCTTCGARYRGTEDTTECRTCRGWHPCSRCGEAYDNEEYYSYSDQGRVTSVCRPCISSARKAAINPKSRRITTTQYTSRSEVLAAYQIEKGELRLLDEALQAYRAHNLATVCRGPRPETPTAVEVLRRAGYGFDLRISQAVMELYRLEKSRENAAA